MLFVKLYLLVNLVALAWVLIPEDVICTIRTYVRKYYS